MPLLSPRSDRKLGRSIRILLAPLLLAWLAAPAPAMAQEAASPAAEPGKRDPNAKARAQKHFERGITAYKEGRFKDAIDAFLDAHREYPSPTLSFNAARAYEKMGDSTGALRFYREYLRQSPLATDRGVVETRISDLEKKLQARGVQQVTVVSNVEGATVIVDGRPVGVAPWTGEILPGRHTVELRREGYEPAHSEFELLAHRSLDVRLEMQAAPQAPTNPTPSRTPETTPSPVPPQHDTKTGLSKVGVPTWVAFGVGVAGLGGALVFEGLRSSSEDAVKTERYQVDRHDAYDRMKSQQTVARVLAGVGAAGVVVGGVLLYFDLSEPSSPESARVGVGCGASGCGATVRGAF